MDIVAPCRLLCVDDSDAAADVGAAASPHPARTSSTPQVDAACAGIADNVGSSRGSGSGEAEFGGIAVSGEDEGEIAAVKAGTDDSGGCSRDTVEKVNGGLEGQPAHKTGAACTTGDKGEGSAPSVAIVIRRLAAQLETQLGYVLEDEGGVHPLTEEQQRRVQLSVGRWRNAGLGAVFNTWRHVLGLIAVHRVGLLEIYHAACREQQLPATAATAGVALHKFLADPVGGAIMAAHSGLGPPSAAALACALRATSLAGERYPSLDIVHLRAFERMTPLTALDLSDNNIRDEGLAMLVVAIVAVGVALTAFNASCNNLTDRSGDQARISALCLRVSASC